MGDLEHLAIHAQELRRGSVVLAVLSVLDVPRYGYALLQELERAGISTDGNTLYPLLRRLEGQGLLASEWNTDESRPRKFYSLTDSGRATQQALTLEWHSLRTSLDHVTRKDES